MISAPGSERTGFRSLSGPARLLVVNHFGINAGFFMVMPFLAVYLRDDLGYGAAVVGLMLGLRIVSQQGMFPIGGVAADRIGCRPVIIAGCSLRVVAFGSFAVFTSLPGIITATVLTGLGSALFNPALRTYLMAESGARRAATFAVDNVFGNAGALVGPLLGVLLLAVDFRVVALVAAMIFAVLTVAQLLMLPVDVDVTSRNPQHDVQPVPRLCRMVEWTRGGRMIVRVAELAQPMPRESRWAEHERMIQSYVDVCATLAAQIREDTTLAPGEALVVDNYRCLHGVRDHQGRRTTYVLRCKTKDPR